MSYKLNACRKLMAGAAFISLSLPFATLSASDDSWPQGAVSFIMHTQAGGSADVFHKNPG